MSEHEPSDEPRDEPRDEALFESNNAEIEKTPAHAARISQLRAAVDVRDDDAEASETDDDETPHATRINRLRRMSDQIVQNKPTSGQKRGHRAAFGDFDWTEQLERIYTNEHGFLREFRPTTTDLSDSGFRFLHSTIKMIKLTSKITIFELCNEADKVELVDAVMRSVVAECDRRDRVELKREVPFKCQRLNAIGRVDRVVTKHGHKALVLECKRNDFNKGFAQMAIGTEAMLLEHLEDHPDSDDSVYGIVTNFISWHFMELTRHEARFYQMHLMAHSNFAKGLREVASALLSILRGLPTTKVDEEEDGDDLNLNDA